MMALEGIRVLDWTVMHAGPAASMMLADLGADVIKIERPVTGDPARGFKRFRAREMPNDRAFLFDIHNRNKRAITLDLQKPEGREILYRMVKKADVFVQNHRLGVAEKMGLDYTTLSKYNTRLIYGTATGLGPKGPERNDPFLDTLGVARSGIMYLSGEPDMPPLALYQGISDHMASIMLAYGILAALVNRERTGIGQEVYSSQLGAMIALEVVNVSGSLMIGSDLGRQFRSAPANPLQNHYKCRDGEWLVLALLQSDRYWPDFCEVMGIQSIQKDTRFENMLQREKHSKELVATLDQVFARKPRDEWIRILKQKNLLCGPVQTVAELLDDPQVIANKYIINFEHPSLGYNKMVGIPVYLSGTPGSVRLPPPEFGQHTEEVLAELADCSSEEISQLKEKEVI